MNLPTFETYANSGVNSLRIDLPTITIWFSYQTPIAFRISANISINPVVRVNNWSTTTGKHLNAIDGGDKNSRISGEQFEDELSKALES